MRLATIFVNTNQHMVASVTSVMPHGLLGAMMPIPDHNNRFKTFHNDYLGTCPGCTDVDS